MAGNPFDTLGMYDDDLAGVFSKVKKAVKKVAKKAENVVRKVRDKALPSKVAKELSRAAKNPVVRGVALVGAAMVAGPAVAGALKGGAATLAKTAVGKAAVGAGAKAATVVTAKGVAGTVAKAAVSSAAQKAIGKKLTKKQKLAVENQAQLTPDIANTIAKNNAAVMNSPEFQEVVKTMQAAGATPEEIQQAWVNSQNYQQMATYNAAQASYPAIVRQLNSAGIYGQQAEDLARAEALQVGQEAAESVKDNTNTIGKIALIGIPLAFALFGG